MPPRQRRGPQMAEERPLRRLGRRSAHDAIVSLLSATVPAMADDVVLRGIGGAPGSRLAELLGEGLAFPSRSPGAVGRLGRVVVDVSGPGELLLAAGDGLPEGPARPEAVAARLRRRGIVLRWGAAVQVDDVRDLLEHCRRRGRSSVEILRADPSLITELQVGAWFDGPWRMRCVRRALQGPAATRLTLRSRRTLAAVADAAFWAGVRERATRTEWQRLTASSYTALLYHRFAGELKPGQERLDV